MYKNKPSAVVKIATHIVEKVPTLSIMEMLRIIDARNTDIGHNKVTISNERSADALQRLMNELSDEHSQGPAQRFRDYCQKFSVNRRLVLN